MVKDFRMMSRLPEDFISFDFMETPPRPIAELDEEFSAAEADRLRGLISAHGFYVDSDMIGTKAAIEKAAVDALGKDGADLSGITVEATNPHWLSYYKDGKEFAEQYGGIDVNEKYMDGEEFPLIPTKDEYEDLGCSWIENGDPEWKDFEQVENALNANKAAEEDFAAGISQIPNEDVAQER